MQARGWTAVAVLCATGVSLVAQTTRPASQPTTGPTTVPATEPATAPAAMNFPPADEVLKQLASDDRRERRKAQDLLVHGGEDGRPFVLELIRQATTPEARKNAEAALAQIDQNRLVGPSYITLHVKDAAPRDVFAELSKQCHAPLLTYPDNLWDQGPWQKLTLDVDRQPFWEVMPQICQKIGVDFRPFQFGMRLMRTGGMQMQGMLQIQGPFLIVANQITRTQTRHLGGANVAQSQFGLNLTVYAEPKITVLRTAGNVKIDEATDDHGNSLIAPENAARNFWGGYAGVGGWALYAPMRYPDKNPGTRIVKFKGSTTFIIQTKMQTLELQNVLALHETTRTVNGVQLTFKELKKQGDVYQLQVRLGQPSFGGAEWQQLVDGLQNRLQLQDAEGRPFDHRGMSSSGTNDSLDMTLDFARSPRPDGKTQGEASKLVWEIPLETKEVNVPIEFHDLPLFEEK